MFFQTAFAEEPYTAETAPPATGWGSAVKYFQKDPDSSVSTSASNWDYASKKRMFFLDNVFFVSNRETQPLDTPGQWGLNLGFEWDESIFGEGVYVNYMDYEEESKFSFLYGFIYPRIQTRFPLYIKANAGLGYFTGAFNDETLAVDYNLLTGLRFFTKHNVLLNLEFGSKNYTRIFRRSQLNSLVVSSGLAFVF